MAPDSTPLTVVTDMQGSAVILTPRGTLDSATYRLLRDEVIKAALDEPSAVLVDVAELDVPAESAWAVFTSARWHVDRWPEVPIVLICAHRAGREAIARNGVSRYVPVFPDVETAIAHVADAGTMRIRRRARTELPAALASLQRARELVVDWLTAWSKPEMIPVAKVVVTTLVVNVLQHTDSQPGLRLEANGAPVTIAVYDSSHTLPNVRECVHHTVAPSGLQVVAALCRSWGSAPTTSGKTVWAVIGPENIL